MGSFFSKETPPALDQQDRGASSRRVSEPNADTDGVSNVPRTSPKSNEFTKNSESKKRPADALSNNGKATKRPRTVPHGENESEHERFCVRCKSIFWLSKKEITKLVNNATDVPEPVGLHKIARWPYFFATFRKADAEVARSSLAKLEFRGEQFQVTDASMPSERRARADENVARSDELVFEQRDAGTVTAPWGSLPYDEQRMRMKRAWKDALVRCQKRMMNDKFVRRGTEWLRQLNSKDPVCPLDEGVFCEDEEYRDFYRNKNEFTVGMSRPNNNSNEQNHVPTPIVGYTLGQSKDGDFRIGKLDDKCRTTSKTARQVAKALERVVKSSGQPVYNRKNHEGYWRLVTVRNSSRTNQVIVIVMVCAQGALPKRPASSAVEKDVVMSCETVPDDKEDVAQSISAPENFHTTTRPADDSKNMTFQAGVNNCAMTIEENRKNPQFEDVVMKDVGGIHESKSTPPDGIPDDVNGKQELGHHSKHTSPQNPQFARRNALMLFDAENAVAMAGPADVYLSRCVHVDSTIAKRNESLKFDTGGSVDVVDKSLLVQNLKSSLRNNSSVQNSSVWQGPMPKSDNGNNVKNEQVPSQYEESVVNQAMSLEPTQTKQPQSVACDVPNATNLKDEKNNSNRILDDTECRQVVQDTLRELFGEGSFGLHWQRSDELTPRPTVTPMEHVHGLAELEEELLGLRINVHPSAFFQVNTVMAERLYTLIRDWASVTKDTTILDVCCGTGTIGLSMARHARAVFGVDLSEPAIKSAKRNARLNNITNATFIAGAAEKVISDVMQLVPNNFDCVAVLDPPRDGVAPNVISAVRGAAKVKRIVYVACKPKNAWKNILQLCRPTSKAFRGVPFRPIRATGVDLFPHTPHGELVILLERTQ